MANLPVSRNYCAKCCSTWNIKAAVSTAELEIKGDLAKKKIDTSKAEGGKQVRQHHASGGRCAERNSPMRLINVHFASRVE